MKVEGVHRRTIWLADDGWSVEIIDQTRLPRELVVARLTTADAMARAIREMWVRGAPLIGVAGAYGLALAAHADPSDAALERAAAALLATRPTAVNLRWAIDALHAELAAAPAAERARLAYARAAALADEDVATCRAIGQYGAALLATLHAQSGAPVEVLTHCNAGWLATVDWGTAMAPVYTAHDAGVPLHVWVDETRPRNQGLLTAWELGQHGVPHTFIADNTGGHLMQRGRVDVVIVGTDRTTSAGDVCNKIGTYLKALAAHDNRVPFYAAVPHSSIDWSMARGDAIPIEERDGAELGAVPAGTRVANFAFDVTPARLVTGLITERGVCAASREGLLALYPERRPERQRA